MKPYYEHAGITIYHGDCREVLPKIESDSVDLIVTDPPYGVRWQSGNRTIQFAEIQGDDSTEAAIVGISLCVNLLRRGRHIYAFGKYDLSRIGVAGPAEIIWDKEIFSAGNLRIPWGCQHETISFYVNNKDGKLNKTPDGALTTKLRRGSVIRCKRLNGEAVSEHPTEKPVKLLRQLIESSSVMDELVLDPFMGVGTALQAAALECRRAIGIEIEEKYCEIAAKRLSQQVLEFT